ncbi:DUF397 domain-containing protein [Pseudonocardia acaciae]|uniref:DUF397 domain-containing protein n=1 Tax=Pseudonocardia acaciae TaxID=551276 RepID=UPI0004904866|nr:DUF397 domain-containing protein [Pseudonocardia acaciae]
MEELTGLRWFKSSHSGGSGGAGAGECIEAAALGDRRAVRDSTDPEGPAFVFPSASWAGFVAAVKRGDFDGGEAGSAVA